MTRVGLTQADWKAIISAASSGQPDDALVQMVEKRVLARLRKAWGQGYLAGWDDGVNDANDDEPPPPKTNPYGGAS